MLSTAAWAAAAAADTCAWEAEDKGGELEGEWGAFCDKSGGDRLLLIELIEVFAVADDDNVAVGEGDSDEPEKIIVYMQWFRFSPEINDIAIIQVATLICHLVIL